MLTLVRIATWLMQRVCELVLGAGLSLGQNGSKQMLLLILFSACVVAFSSLVAESMRLFFGASVGLCGGR